jgi:hypothetical protein
MIIDHTHWIHHTSWDSSGRVIDPSQKPLLGNTQHSQETDIHASGGIRTRYSSYRAAVDPRLRPRGHRNRQLWVNAYFSYNCERESTKDANIHMCNAVRSQRKEVVWMNSTMTVEASSSLPTAVRAPWCPPAGPKIW